MQYTAENTLRLAKRYNNARRAYLLVNPLQAKHMPVRPTAALDMMNALGQKLAAHYPNAKLVIGFAETATAIGAAVASCLHPDCVYLQTTREDYGNAQDWLLFLEEHSHAVEQKLCAENLGRFISDTQEIILVDDELSTGKTLINIVEQIRQAFPAAREKTIIAASIINRLSLENEERLTAAGIGSEYLVKLSDDDLTGAVAHFNVEAAKIPETDGASATYTPVTSATALLNPRFGLKMADYADNCERVAQSVLNAAKHQLNNAHRILILGTEECMYPALTLGKMLENQRPDAQVLCHATTRSPIGVLDQADYPIRTGVQLHSFYGDDRRTFLYNLAAYDLAIVLTDTSADDSKAAAELVSALKAHGCARVIVAEGGKRFGSYRPEDATILLKDVTGLVTPLGTKEREAFIQRGVHYSEMLPIEYEPSEKYLNMFHKAMGLYAGMTADAVASVAEKIWRNKGQRPVLLSLARAGTPVGVLIRRYLKQKYRADVPHYSISIIRGKGVDRNAMDFILSRHAPQQLQFVDGWTGKGAIARQLTEAMADYPNVSDGLAVLSDPAGIAEVYGTRDDFLIASSCLNSTVSGLLSRTFFRTDIIGAEDFHGAAFYRELAEQDLTYAFIDTVASLFPADCPAPNDDARDVDGMAEVAQICRDFDVQDVNLVKPSIGEATRVLLRRVPWKVLVHSMDDPEHLGHLYQLAEEKGVELVVYPLKNYRACGLIRSLADN